MIRRSIKFRCGAGNCKVAIECITDNIREAEALGRLSGWLMADGEWLTDLCPKHWEAEKNQRIKAGFIIINNNKGLPRLKPLGYMGLKREYKQLNAMVGALDDIGKDIAQGTRTAL